MSEFWYVLWRLPLVAIFALPATLASIAWHYIAAGWVFGEWLFDRDGFEQIYGKPVNTRTGSNDEV